MPFCIGGEVPRQSFEKKIAEWVRELIRQTCVAFGIQTVKINGVVIQKHVRIFASSPAELALCEIMMWIKGDAASKLFEEFQYLKRQNWKQALLCNDQLTKKMIK